ncbi:hypothetical protein H4R19_003538 [Coemansia spiralis]|nr:hypothetical protein H4R19_003538 [Coemansia spiralis]
MKVAYDTARIMSMAQHRDYVLLPDDGHVSRLPVRVMPFLESEGRPVDMHRDQVVPANPWTRTADMATGAMYAPAPSAAAFPDNLRPIWSRPQLSVSDASRPSVAFITATHSVMIPVLARPSPEKIPMAVGTVTSTLAPTVVTIRAPALFSLPPGRVSNMYLVASPSHEPVAAIRLPASVPPATSASHAMPATSVVEAAFPTIASVRTSAQPSRVHPTGYPGDARSESDAGIAATSSVSDGGALRTPSHRLSDGFVILISVAVVFVCAIMFYYYVRRRKRPASETGSPNGRSILSSHSGMPSVGADDEDKYIAPDNKYTHYMPDSGASIGYQSKDTGMTAGKRLVPGTSTHPTRFVQLKLPEFGTHFVVPSREPCSGVYNFCSSDVSCQLDMAAANPDIYDYVPTGKEDNAQSLVLHAFRSAQEAVPAPAAANSGSVSVDQMNTRTQNPVARDESAMLARKGALLPLTGRHGADTASLNTDMQIPAFPMPPTDDEAKLSLLDTTSANPGRVKQAAADGVPGPKIKPRKLTRSTNRLPAKGAHAKPSRGPGEVRDISGPVGLQTDVQLDSPQGGVADRPDSEALGRIPMIAPLNIIPEHRGLPLPMTQGSLLSIGESRESLSDNYQFAVRHDPPLGPLPAVEPHVPALSDELRIKQGDEICVLGEFADGWVMAVNTTRGNEFGMIPRRCLFFPTAPFMSEKSLLEASQLQPDHRNSPNALAPSDRS